MSKKIYGECCICGENKELNFEHIPPKSAFNKLGIKLYDYFEYLSKNNIKYLNLQKGLGKHTLCYDCNSLTGAWYGTAYAEFAMQGLKYYSQNISENLVLPYTIYPLRVFKQIISCFASINGSKWCKKNPQIKKFLLNRYEKIFPTDIEIRMYMQTENRSKISGIKSLINIKTGEIFVGSEFAYTPFGFICICDKYNTNFNVLNELYSVTDFLNYNYDDKVTLFINMPRKPCNPTTLDFRDKVPFIGRKK